MYLVVFPFGLTDAGSLERGLRGSIWRAFLTSIHIALIGICFVWHERCTIAFCSSPFGRFLIYLVENKLLWVWMPCKSRKSECFFFFFFYISVLSEYSLVRLVEYLTAREIKLKSFCFRVLDANFTFPFCYNTHFILIVPKHYADSQLRYFEFDVIICMGR